MSKEHEEKLKESFDDKIDYEKLLHTLFYKYFATDEETKENANVQITRTFYGEDTINKTLGKINNQIEAYRSIYKDKPVMILISKELEILFQMQLELMSQHEMIIINGEPISIHRVFGLSCITTPTLKDLEFMVV